MVDKRLQTFGQNMDVCLSLLNRTHEDLSAETGIAATELKKMHTGESTLSIAELQSIADEINIPARYLTQSYRSEDRVARLQAVLEEVGLVASDLGLFVPLSRESKLPPTIRRAPTPDVLVVGVVNPQPVAIPKAPSMVLIPAHVPATEPSIPDLLQLDIEPATPDVPKSNAEPVPAKAPKQPSARKPPVVDEIDPALVMSFEGIDYNLRDKVLKQALVDRIRYLKGNLTYSELAARLSKKRTYAWLTNLGGITPAEVVDIATICNTTAKELVTGKGIIPLAAGEKASEWLERYIIETNNKEALKEVAHEILHSLEKWSAPLQHMIVKYLAEIV